MKDTIKRHFTFIWKVGLAQALSASFPVILITIRTPHAFFPSVIAVGQLLFLCAAWIGIAFIIIGLPYAIVGRFLTRRKKLKKLPQKSFDLVVASVLSLVLVSLPFMFGRQDWFSAMGALALLLFQLPTIWYFSKVSERE